MTTSQNGWPVHTSQTNLTPLSWVTGRVRGGDVHAIFDHFCQWFHREIEPITKGHSWGWAYRPIRGRTTGLSNHASGTAIDLNAPKHPLGARGTFTAAQAAKIRAKMREYGGAIRWGGDYSGRKDEMHFEINTSADALRRVVANLGTTTPTTSPGVPSTGHDPKTDLERLLDSMTKEELEALIYEQANKAVKDNLAAIGGVVYTKAAEVARDREKRDGDISYVKAAEVARDSRNATADAIADRLRTKLGLDTTAQG